VLSLRCLVCGQDYAPGAVDYVCPAHGDDGVLDVRYAYDRIAQGFTQAGLAANRDSTMWRWRPLLPIRADSPVPPLTVGGTPLYDAPRLAAQADVARVWVKDEGRQPTASLKDRASAMAVVKAHERGSAVITTASTGNAAAALAGLCASVGRSCVIFVPETAPPAKIAQLLVLGGTVLLVRGTYDQAFDLCLQASREFGWYNRNTGFNPYMTEGKKTVACEICEQLGWEAPDAVFVPVGDGSILGGVHKGLKDLRALGWIARMPRLIGVQAAGSAALYRAWRKGTPALAIKPIEAHTVADSISAGLPRDRIKALAAVRETGGAFVQVTDEEILAAIPALGQGCGVFAEPAAAAAWAGLRRARADGLLGRADRAVVLVTGSGLKDIASARRSVGDPAVVDPTIEAVRQAVARGITP